MSRAPLLSSQLCQSTLRFALALATIIISVSLVAVTSRAAERQSSAPNVPVVRHIVVTVNKSQLIRFDKQIRTATIASTAIADVTPMTDRSLYIQGKAVGTTNISVFDQNMQLV